MILETTDSKSSVWKILTQTYRSLVTDWKNWLNISFAPWCLSLIALAITYFFTLEYTKDFYSELQSFQSNNGTTSLNVSNLFITLVIFFASSITSTILSVYALIILLYRISRYTILNELPEGFLNIKFNKSHWNLLANICVVGFLYFTFFYVVLTPVLDQTISEAFTLKNTHPSPQDILNIFKSFLSTHLFSTLPWIVAFGAIVLFTFSRLTMSFPAASCGHENSLKYSWNATSGTKWLKLALFLIILTVPLVAFRWLTFLGTGHTFSADISDMPSLGYLFYSMMIYGFIAKIIWCIGISLYFRNGLNPPNSSLK